MENVISGECYQWRMSSVENVIKWRQKEVGLDALYHHSTSN